jgi:hypothetical protein
MDNSLTDFEIKGAYYWLFGFGLVSLIFCYTLTRIDETLTNSNREQVLNNTLKEVRSAQHSFTTGRVDSRQLVTESVYKDSAAKAK